MKYSYPVAAAIWLIGSAVASPAPFAGLVRRTPSLTENLPSGDKVCDVHNYNPGDIRTAVEFGWDAVQNNQKYSYKKGKAEYPHQFTPTQMDMEWTDFDLGNCAQESDDKAKKSGFQEFPIVPGGSPWEGGEVKPGPDRVIFQVVDKNTAAFCGIIRHPGLDGVRTHFQMCIDAPPPPLSTPPPSLPPPV